MMMDMTRSGLMQRTHIECGAVVYIDNSRKWIDIDERCPEGDTTSPLQL